MASSLREELESLRIERPGNARGGDRASSRQGPGPVHRRRRGVGLRLVSLLLWMLPLGVIAGAAAVGYRQYERIRGKPEVNIGLVQTMTLGEAEKLLSAKGYLKSRHQAMIGTRIAGRVEEMRVQERAKVKKGDILAVLEHHDLDAMLLQRQASLLRTEAELEEAKIDFWDKDRQEKRLERLFSKNMTPLEDYERATAARRMTEARIAALEASLKVMQASIEEIEVTIRYQMHLYAPFDGTVVEKQGEIGEVINPIAMSSSLGRSAVVTIADLSKMDVEADVPEEQMYRVNVGQPAEISVTAVPIKRYRGRLWQITPMGDRTRATVKVKVEILDPDDHLFPELAATVHFLPDKNWAESDANQSFLFVPRAAVFEEDGRRWVWLLGVGEQVRKRQIEVANSTGDEIRVASGLELGDRVVLDPPRGLHDGDAIREASR